MSLSFVPSPPRLARDVFKSLQQAQYAHDVRYHADIWSRPPQQIVVHMTLHQTKYLSGLVEAQARGDKAALRRLILDAFIVTLATANVLKQDMAGEMIFDADGAASLADVSARMSVTECLSPFERAVFRYAYLNGRMAKACEALDHLEAYPFVDRLREANAGLCRLVLGLAHEQGMIETLEEAYHARLHGIEARAFIKPPSPARRPGPYPRR